MVLSGDLVEWHRTGGTVGYASERLPLNGNGVHFLCNLVCVYDVLVALGRREIREGKVGSLEWMIVIGGGQLAQSLIVIVAIIVYFNGTVVYVLTTL